MNDNNGKATVIQDFNSLSISIPISTPIVILMMSIFVIGLLLYNGLYEVTRDNFFNIDFSHYTDVIIALIFIFLILNIIRTWLWMLFGKEILVISNNDIKIKNSILGMGITKTIPIPEVTKISVNLNPSKQQPAKILIHRGEKTIGFGTPIQANESVYLVGLMKNKLGKLNPSFI